MRRRTRRRVAVLGVLCLLGVSGPRGLGPSVVAQSQNGPNNGWASVDCDKEPSGALQRAIDRATPGQTIQVSGTCYENVEIRPGKNLITLDGGGNGAVHGADVNVNTIQIRGPQGITIRGLTVSGGRAGIDISRGATALIDGNTIENTGRNG